ncbi:MAG: tetratricopeptide repeat protein [Candidatus Obscuribacterales bacterium]|nr:tetratricopeptide repeat protein [Candidatus Obscuribacterales bacterium]
MRRRPKSISLSVVGLSAILGGIVLPAYAQAPAPGGQVGSGDVLTGQVRQHTAIPAEDLLSQGKYSDAEDLFRQLLVANPQDTNASVGLGLALAKQFKLDAADDLFDRVLTADPNNALAHAGKATVTLNRLQSSSGSIRSQRDSLLKYAEDESRRACQLAPASAEAHYTLGAVLREEGKTDEAASEFKTAISFDGKNSQAFSGLGRITLEKGSIGEAMEYFRRAIELNSGNSTAHFGLGSALLQQGQIDDAIKELNIALYQFPNSAPVHLAMGDAYQRQGNEAAALKEYQAAATIKPELPDPYLKMADIRENRGDLELALADLRSGLAQIPYNIDLRMRIADNLLKLEKSDDAIKNYKVILGMSPNNPQAVKGLSQALYIKAQKTAAGALLASNDYDSALKTLDEAMKLNPDDMELRLAQAKLMSLSGGKLDLSKIGDPTSDGQRIAYAEALMAQGEFQKASAVVADVITRMNDPKQTFAVADLALMINDLDNAEVAYRKAQSLSGTPERVQRGLDAVAKQRKIAIDDVKVGDELINKRQYDGAIERYRDAIGTNPKLADARFGLARTLEKKQKPTFNDLRDAAQQYLLYVALKPDLPEKDKQKLLSTADKLSEKADKLAQKK